ncbi:MAG: helix-turn-helix domain-containing protein [Phycisphaerae bacterium]|nr:helix-turn-helix domain-containing protein [Phycisphaerae bacterium]
MNDRSTESASIRHRAGGTSRVADSNATDLDATRVELADLMDPCSSAELAAVLGKSPKTIVDWCQERDYTLIPCFRLGNRWYHRKAELMRWLNGIKSGQVEFRRKPRNSAERR